MAKKTTTTTTVTYTCDTCGAAMETNWATQMVLVGMAYPDNVYCGVEINNVHTAGGFHIKTPDLCANCVRKLLTRALNALPKEA